MVKDMFIVEWWYSLTLLEQIFALLAIPSTLLLLIQTVLLIIGIGHGNDMHGEGAHDGGPEADHSTLDDHYDTPDSNTDDFTDVSGLRLFTVRGFIAFFTIFGWLGIVCSKNGANGELSVIIALAGGMLSMFLNAYLLKTAMKLQVNGSTNLINAIGKSGTVYIRIPANRSAKGKISIIVQEQLIEADAVTDEDTDLLTGKEVVAVGMSGQNTLIVANKK